MVLLYVIFHLTTGLSGTEVKIGKIVALRNGTTQFSKSMQAIKK